MIWEYYVGKLDPHDPATITMNDELFGEPLKIDMNLDELGAEGWELVGFHAGFAYFKRPRKADQ